MDCEKCNYNAFCLKGELTSSEGHQGSPCGNCKNDPSNGGSYDNCEGCGAFEPFMQCLYVPVK